MYQLFNSQHFFSFLFNKFQIKEAIYLYVCVHTLKHTHTHTHSHTHIPIVSKLVEKKPIKCSVVSFARANINFI